jgi:ABC-2 type transport system ATP-binding protein
VLLVRTDEEILDPAWTVKPVSLEDLVLAYMRQPNDAARTGRPRLEVAS